MKRGLVLLLSLALAAVIPATALADSISPDTFSATVAVGESVSLHKTVTVEAGRPTTAQADIYFLCDTTGSMGGTISTVKSNATYLLNNLAGLGNVAFGAGSYRDFPSGVWGASGDYPYRLDSAIGTQAAAQAGINTWTAGGGNDTPESQLYALQQAAVQSATGWRADSKKFIVWFGDAPGHEPSNTSGYPGPSTAQTVSALQSKGIAVDAVNVGYGGLNSYGQATTIASATGGKYYYSYSSGLIGDIISAIGSAFDTYKTVTLRVDAADPATLAAVTSAIHVGWDPSAITGDFDRSIARLFDFDVTFTGLAAGTYDFFLTALVDGYAVASEHDVITVRGSVPEPGTMLLLGSGLVTLAGMRRKFAAKR